MDAISFFEQLANMTHQQLRNELVSILPTELKDAFIANNSQFIRKKLSGKQTFPDSRAVIRD